MNKFQQHIPNFVDNRDPVPVYEFETTKELLNLDIVKKYIDGRDYHKFVMSDNYLMIIWEDGFRWWVVGYITNPSNVDLPKWDGGKHRGKLANGEVVILNGDDVSSIWGDLIILNDGTEVKKIESNL